jgi:hypothetical protein
VEFDYLIGRIAATNKWLLVHGISICGHQDGYAESISPSLSSSFEQSLSGRSYHYETCSGTFASSGVAGVICPDKGENS